MNILKEYIFSQIRDHSSNFRPIEDIAHGLARQQIHAFYFSDDYTVDSRIRIIDAGLTAPSIATVSPQGIVTAEARGT